MRKAVFFDKDGTLIRNIPYNADPDLIALEPGACEAVAQLRRHGFALVLVSNQSGIARGMFAETAMGGIRHRLETLLENPFDGFYFCPHHPEGNNPPYNRACECRKPLPGMLLHAAEELELSLHHSWMIGDILHDVEAGNRAGCKTILINNGNETEWEDGAYRKPHYIAANLNDAVAWIFEHENQGRYV